MLTRIATVGYLNAAPLVAGLDGDHYEVSSDIPSRVAHALREGHVDVALTPVVSALNDGNFRIVGGIAIGSDGPVHSVVLVAETEPADWKEIVLDGESRTSAILTQVLLRGPLASRCSATVRTVDPGAGVECARGTTAALVIGDAAMNLPERLTVRLDLGEIWTEWTGLPFIFAVWAGRPELPGAVRDDLRASAELGLAAVAEKYSGQELSYLQNNIRYTLDDRALMGLRRFAALAHSAGLIKSRDVRLYGPSQTRYERGEAGGLALERAAHGEWLEEEALMECALTQRLADLAAAASLRSEPPSLPSVVLGRRIAVDAEPAEVAASLRGLHSSGVEVIVLEGLASLSPTQASVRLDSLAGIRPLVLSLDIAEYAALQEQWNWRSTALLDWLNARGVKRISGLSVDDVDGAMLACSDLSLVVRVPVQPSEDPAEILNPLLRLRRRLESARCRLEVELWPQALNGRRTSAVEGLRALCLFRIGVRSDLGLVMNSDAWGPAVAGTSLRMGATDLAVLMADQRGLLEDGEQASEHRARLVRELEANGFSGVAVPVSERSSRRATQA